MFAFVWELALPVTIFVYCYGRIFYIIRQHNRVSGDASLGQGINMATLSAGQNVGQVQQQESEATAGVMSRTELNILQTMTAIIVCFVLCWSPASVASVVQTILVCKHVIHVRRR